MNINVDYLKKEEINSYSHKVRVIIKDENDKIYITNMNGSYNLVGGRVKANEDLSLALIREIKEEMGLTIKQEELKYLNKYIFYHKNFPYYKMRENEIDLFLLTTPKKIDLKKRDLTSYELEHNFKIIACTKEEIKNLIKEKNDNPYKPFTDLELQVLLDIERRN